jgi:hypothetical protein
VIKSYGPLCRKCFCAAGWYGDACEKQSDFLSHKYNKSAYIKTHLETHKRAPKLYWRIVEGELEMIGEFEALETIPEESEEKIVIRSGRTPFCLCCSFTA